ncbi:MAG: hypothetical protein BWY58_00042 [Chloroflexi bacterium ADurb.Bin344]|nr:MAG: hypothetical protein BWY58_00042 [Chloroflexi bacterium ADurb.Bin344]
MTRPERAGSSPAAIVIVLILVIAILVALYFLYFGVRYEHPTGSKTGATVSTAPAIMILPAPRSSPYLMASC